LEQLSKGKVNLDDLAVTLKLLKLNAIIGVTGFFNSSGSLRSVGLQCSVCHPTVDNSRPALCAGAIEPNRETGCVGRRLEGWPNRDLNVVAIVALAPNVEPVADLLQTITRALPRRMCGWCSIVGVRENSTPNCSSMARPSTQARSRTT